MGVSHYASAVLSVWYRVTIQIGKAVEFMMFNHPDWAEGSHSSSPPSLGVPQSKSTQPQYQPEWSPCISHPCPLVVVVVAALGRNFIDGGVLVAAVVAVKVSVAGVVVGHASSDICTGSKLEALTKLGDA